jgi:hypothetical protein
MVFTPGGGAALVGAWMLGPRLGRFGPNGQIFKMDGCNTSNKVEPPNLIANAAFRLSASFNTRVEPELPQEADSLPSYLNSEGRPLNSLHGV